VADITWKRTGSDPIRGSEPVDVGCYICDIATENRHIHHRVAKAARITGLRNSGLASFGLETQALTAMQK
jgi:hypothetical protein